MTNTDQDNTLELCYESLPCPADDAPVFSCHLDKGHEGPHEGTSNLYRQDATCQYAAVAHWVSNPTQEQSQELTMQHESTYQPATYDVANRYRELVMRTAPKEYKPLTTTQMHLVHAVLGMLTELGELADPIKKHIIYGKPLDHENYTEEDGDMRWYMGLGEHAMGSPHEDTIKYQNIEKLRRRYPAQFSESDALARADKARTPSAMTG